MSLETCVVFYSSSDHNNALDRNSPFYRQAITNLSARYAVHEVELIHANVDSLIHKAEETYGPVRAIYFWAHGSPNGSIRCNTGFFTPQDARSSYLSQIHTVYIPSCHVGTANGVATELAKRNITVFASDIEVTDVVTVIFQNRLALLDLDHPGRFKQMQNDQTITVALAPDDLESQIREKNEPFLLFCFLQKAGRIEEAVACLLQGILEGCERCLVELSYYKEKIPPGKGPADLIGLLQARSEISKNPAVDRALGDHFRKMGDLRQSTDAYIRGVEKGDQTLIENLKELGEIDGYALYKLAEHFLQRGDQNSAEMCLGKLKQIANSSPPDKAVELYLYCANLGYLDISSKLLKAILSNPAILENCRNKIPEILHFLDKLIEIKPAAKQKEHIKHLLTLLTPLTEDNFLLKLWCETLQQAVLGPTPEICLKLGMIHDQVKISETRALDWYKKAASGGNHLAASILSEHYERMHHLTKDANFDSPHLPLALHYAKRAQQIKDPVGSVRLAQLLGEQQIDHLRTIRLSQSAPEPILQTRSQKEQREALLEVLDQAPSNHRSQDDSDAVSTDILQKKASRKVEILKDMI